MLSSLRPSALLSRAAFTPLLAVAAVVALGTTPASAQVFTETTDAGFTPQTAIAVGGGITTINGTVGVAGDVDFYRFDLATSTLLNITATSPADNFVDPNLILLDGNFIGIGASDDQGGTGPLGFDSRITINLGAGTYYIAYGENNIYAYSSSTPNSDDPLFNDDSGDGNGVVTGQTTPVGSIGGDGGSTGPYTITFSQATAGASAAAPEPGTIALLLTAGVPVAGLVRRRNR